MVEVTFCPPYFYINIFSPVEVFSHPDKLNLYNTMGGFGLYFLLTLWGDKLPLVIFLIPFILCH